MGKFVGDSMSNVIPVGGKGLENWFGYLVFVFDRVNQEATDIDYSLINQTI